jgi:hypothetical protein
MILYMLALLEGVDSQFSDGPDGAASSGPLTIGGGGGSVVQKPCLNRYKFSLTELNKEV